MTLNPIVGLQSELTLQTHCPDSDLVSRKLHSERLWEPFETQLWIASQEPGDVVVDVGANLGYFSILSALHPRRASQIFAFEPALDNVTLLQKNLALNNCQDSVKTMPVALGKLDAQASLHRSEDNRGDHQIYAGDGDRREEAITVRGGAKLLSAHTNRIDLLKVDTQGSEFAVMEGLLPLLQASVPRLRILLELTPYSLRLAQSSGRALIMLIAELGLPLWIVDHIEHRLVPSDAAALCLWADNVEATDGDRGFMNIYAGIAPTELLE
ncbi:FkbM family methyltransferase [Congregibacter variabilis]|uniref:FkbM family methyltransferase n=1 Tax=Congregibacter variabilis TaxID=3081200 RepID=A0ABZ0I7F4_9GAMM|nr:FkbM family methyltransferase [Congregibacter sp. IMCC43200]